MLWNIILHIIAGAVGYGIFTFRYPGFLYCLAVTVVVQGIDMFRYYSRIKKRIDESSGKVREKEMKKFKNVRGFFISTLWYIMKVIFYGLITLVSALIVRQIIL